MCSKGKYLGFLIILLLFLYSCGGKKNNTRVLKKIEITVTGLDGNGIAEKTITNDLMKLDGVKTISFNYLSNQVVVLFDTTLVNQANVITTIMKADEGRYKILDVKENKEPIQKSLPVKPDPQEDIQDDTGDQYKDNG